jgi:hypothetical protein
VRGRDRRLSLERSVRTRKRSEVVKMKTREILTCMQSFINRNLEQKDDSHMK